MPVVIVGTEKNFTALRGRLFQKRAPAATVRVVEEAIREANPHVDLTKLEPGTVIRVPRIPGIDFDVGEGVSLDPATRGIIGEVHREVREVLGTLVADAERRQTEDAAERKRLVRTLEGRDVQASIGRDRELAAQLDAAKVALEEETATSKRELAVLRRTATSWDEELAALGDLLT